MAVKRYDPKLVVLTVAGRRITGFGDDAMVSLEYAQDGVTVATGVDGEKTYNLIHDFGATLNVTLKQNSDSVPFMDSLIKHHRINGNALFACVLRDLNNGKVLRSNDCVVMSRPPYAYGKEVQDWQYSIYFPFTRDDAVAVIDFGLTFTL